MRVSSAAVLHLRAVEAMSVTVVVERFLLPVEPLRMLLNTWMIRHANGSFDRRAICGCASIRGVMVTSRTLSK